MANPKNTKPIIIKNDTYERLISKKLNDTDTFDSIINRLANDSERLDSLNKIPEPEEKQEISCSVTLQPKKGRSQKKSKVDSASISHFYYFSQPACSACFSKTQAKQEFNQYVKEHGIKGIDFTYIMLECEDDIPESCDNLKITRTPAMALVTPQGARLVTPDIRCALDEWMKGNTEK